MGFVRRFKSMQCLKLSFVVILFMFLSCTGCATTENRRVQSVNIVEKQQRMLSSPGFVLGAGDTIDIRVWRNDDLNRNVTLDPSGKIRIPLVGELLASGMSVLELNEEITSRLSMFITKPFVDINVTSISSRKVHVLGEVQSPGTFPYVEQLAVWEAVSKAGGFTEDADNNNLFLVKVKDGKASVAVLELDFKKMLTNGIVNNNYYLDNGDILYVSEKDIVGVEKFMIRLSNILLPIQTIERIIYLAPDVIDILTGKAIDGRAVITQ